MRRALSRLLRILVVVAIVGALTAEASPALAQSGLEPGISAYAGWQPFAMVSGWPDGTSVLVTVDTNADGTPEGMVTQPVSYWGTNVWFDPSLAPFPPGTVLVASGGGTTKTLTLADLHIDLADPDSDVVAGIAPVGSTVEVFATHFIEPGPYPSLTADATSGSWTVDFTGTSDLLGGWGEWMVAEVTDDDGDRTQSGANVERPHVEGHLGIPIASVFGWPSDTPVRVRVDFTNDGSLDFDETITIASFSQPFNGNVWLTQPLAPGARILAEGRSGPEKVLVTVPLEVTGANPDTDLVSGTAPPGATVKVEFAGGWGPQPSVTTVAQTPGGAWLADLGAIGVDVVVGTDLSVYAYDDDGDATVRHHRVEATRFEFDGFYSPIDMGITNRAKAGQTVPVKWLLTAGGQPVTDPESFDHLYSYPVTCDDFSGDPRDAIEEYAPGSSGLQDLGGGSWQFNWQTPKSWAGNCRLLYVQFAEGTQSPTVAFSFVR